jgi:hypothetical protein
MVATVEFRHMMWIVMLKSTKDRVLGVDTPVQQATCSVWDGLLTN